MVKITVRLSFFFCFLLAIFGTVRFRDCTRCKMHFFVDLIISLQTTILILPTGGKYSSMKFLIWKSEKRREWKFLQLDLERLNWLAMEDDRCEWAKEKMVSGYRLIRVFVYPEKTDTINSLDSDTVRARVHRGLAYCISRRFWTSTD